MLKKQQQQRKKKKKKKKKKQLLFIYWPQKETSGFKWSSFVLKQISKPFFFLYVQVCKSSEYDMLYQSSWIVYV